MSNTKPYASSMPPFPPEGAAKVDRLNRRRFYQSAARAIVAHTPGDGGAFTVGIYGEWGSGKTSVMKWIEKDLERFSTEVRKVACISWFQPCLSGSHIDIGCQLLGSVYETLRKWEAGDRARTAKRVATNLLLVMIWTLSKAIQVGSDFVNSVGSAILEPTSTGIGVVGSAVGGIVSKAVEEYFGGVDRAATPSELHKRLREAFVALQDESILGSNESLPLFTVMIDDVDRLDPIDARNLFRALKTIGDLPGLVFVVGADPEAVAAMLENGGVGDKDGHRYLEKFVNLPISIPPADRRTLAAMLREELTGVLRELDSLGDRPEFESTLVPSHTEEEEEMQRLEAIILGASNEQSFIRTPRQVLRMGRVFRWRAFYSGGNLHWGDLALVSALQACDLPVFRKMERVCFISDPRHFADHLSETPTEYPSGEVRIDFQRGKETEFHPSTDSRISELLRELTGISKSSPMSPVQRVLVALHTHTVDGQHSSKVLCNDYSHTLAAKRYSNVFYRNSYFRLDLASNEVADDVVRAFVRALQSKEASKAIAVIADEVSPSNAPDFLTKISLSVRNLDSGQLRVMASSACKLLPRLKSPGEKPKIPEVIELVVGNAERLDNTTAAPGVAESILREFLSSLCHDSDFESITALFEAIGSPTRKNERTPGIPRFLFLNTGGSAPQWLDGVDMCESLFFSEDTLKSWTAENSPHVGDELLELAFDVARWRMMLPKSEGQSRGILPWNPARRLLKSMLEWHPARFEVLLLQDVRDVVPNAVQQWATDQRTAVATIGAEYFEVGHWERVTARYEQLDLVAECRAALMKLAKVMSKTGSYAHLHEEEKAFMRSRASTLPQWLSLEFLIRLDTRGTRITTTKPIDLFADLNTRQHAERYLRLVKEGDPGLYLGNDARWELSVFRSLAGQGYLGNYLEVPDSPEGHIGIKAVLTVKGSALLVKLQAEIPPNQRI